VTGFWHPTGIPVAPVICVHGAQVQHGGLRAQGVAIVPATLLRLALGDEQLLSEVAVELYATTARMRPASSAWRRRFSLGSRSHSSGVEWPDSDGS
jgi:hypothetical protein